MKFKFFKSLAPLLLVNFFVISCTNFIPFQDRKNKDESAKNPVITEENQPKNQILPELQTPKNDLAQITQNLNPIGNIKTINDSNNDLSLTRENNNRITENSTSKNNHNLANSSISTIQNPSLDKSQIDNLNFSSLESLVKSNKPKPEPKVELDPKLEQILEQKPEQNPEEIPLVNSEISQVVKDLPVEKTPIINEKLEFSKLSNYDNKPAQKIGFDVTNKARGNAYSYEAFALKSNVIKQENDDHYLGEKNENLNIYWLDKINTGSLSKNEDARKTFFGYFNPRFRKNNFKPDYFGFRSLDYSDQRYKDIFQRNVRFSTGTAILLDSHEGESVFLTNRHVLYVNKRPFWELMAYPFMRFYDNDNVNTVDSLASSGMLSLFWIKTDYDRQIEQLKKRKNRFPGNNSIYIKSPNRWELSQFSTNLHKRYFREEKILKILARI
ncbi:hypothetical protein V6B68_03410 [Mesomycoplasma ovipneumoniae str. Black Butte]